MMIAQHVYRDGRKVDVYDALCAGRPCLHVAEDKGSFTPGRGYTHYDNNPRLVCWTRHVRGCPNPQPEIDPKRLRCCISPRFAPGETKHSKRCRTCGKYAPLWIAKALVALPIVPTVKCKHANCEVYDEWSCDGRKYYRCKQCYACFDIPPKPHQVGETFEEFVTRRSREWKSRFSIGNEDESPVSKA